MRIPTTQSFAAILDRAQKTRAAQAELAATWTWGEKSLGQWDAALAAFDASAPGSLARESRQADLAGETSRGTLDGAFAQLHGQTVTAVGVLRVRARKDAALMEAVDELSARGDGRRAIQEEAEELEVVWEELGAGFVPAPGVELAAFQALLASIPGLTKTYRQAASTARRAAGRLLAHAAQVEDDCVAWYAEATSVFPVGTPEGDMIRGTIPTSYSPPATPPIPPA